MRLKAASLIVALLVGGCGSSLSVPNVEGTKEEPAQTLLASKGLVPVVEYEFGQAPEGTVLRTIPAAGSSVKPDDRITIVVSKGPARIESKDSTIEWYNIGYGKDDWNFTNPYISDGILYIECEPKFASSMRWRDPQREGEGFGRASINDSFSKTVPLVISFDSQTNSAGLRQDVILKIPVTDLDIQKPTTLYLELYAASGGRDLTIKINFSISW